MSNKHTYNTTQSNHQPNPLSHHFTASMQHTPSPFIDIVMFEPAGFMNAYFLLVHTKMADSAQ